MGHEAERGQRGLGRVCVTDGCLVALVTLRSPQSSFSYFISEECFQSISGDRFVPQDARGPLRKILCIMCREIRRSGAPDCSQPSVVVNSINMIYFESCLIQVTKLAIMILRSHLDSKKVCHLQLPQGL